jgi:hypothetical protein
MPGDDQSDPVPVVEPSMQELQLGRVRWELEEREGGAEGGETAVVGH